MQVRLREILIAILVVLLMFVLVRVTLQGYEVSLSSMESNFYDGQCVLVEKVTYRFHSPNRGDVIVFNPPIHTNNPYIKRIIGLPGDKIEIREGKIYINDELLKETTDFGSQIPHSYTYSITIPSDSEQYFVLGDNRNNSSDSRTWGLVAREDIIGRVLLCYWPPGDWGLSPSYSYTLE